MGGWGNGTRDGMKEEGRRRERARFLGGEGGGRALLPTKKAKESFAHKRRSREEG